MVIETKVAEMTTWKCGVCGKPLTDPVSVHLGIDPVCHIRAHRRCAATGLLRVRASALKGEFFPMCKAFWVFNVAQIDGLPESFYAPAEKAADFNPIDTAEAILTASGAKIAHGFDGAFYTPSRDQICLPARERFTSPENYYATALHELTHWTGHESRLAREYGKRFGNDAYAFKELVAELGAAFVVGHVGFVNATIENHAAYLESWLKVLKNDKTAIFTAVKHAGQAYEFTIAKHAGEQPQKRGRQRSGSAA
ncbi:Antirestriction protein [Candidatus Burkholderia brachyanthoides]|nr:Antirestriction protein [Candidatus Burkholderia brachyanthoides]